MLLIAWFWMLPIFRLGAEINDNTPFRQLIQYIPNYTVVNNMLVSSIWEFAFLMYIFIFLTLASKVVNRRYFSRWAIVPQLFLLIGIGINVYMIGKIVIIRYQLNQARYIAVNPNNLLFLNERDHSQIIYSSSIILRSDELESIVCVKDMSCYIPITSKTYMTYNGLFYYFVNNGIAHQGSWSSDVKIENNIAYIGRGR
jgi:hypothetical protein